MEHIMIYPYNSAYESFVTHMTLMNGYKIVELVSPRGWGLEGEIIESGEEGLIVNCDFSAGLSKCTVVWFVEDEYLPLPEKLLWDKLTETIQSKKRIMYTRYKEDKQYNNAIQVIPKELNLSVSKDIPPTNIVKRDFCYPIETPIITVFGLEERTQKFEIQIRLREAFMLRGYKVSSITSKRDSEILNMHSIPDFMFGNRLTEVEKIESYNYYVKQVETLEKPEIIIIGIPGAVMPFDRINHHNYGIMAYEISHAVPSDIAIMCSPYYVNSNGDFSDLKIDLFSKFGFDTYYSHIADMTIETKTLLEDGEINFVTLDKAFIREKINAYQRDDVLDLTDIPNIEKVVNRIMDELTTC